jgi:hypothetical protein
MSERKMSLRDCGTRTSRLSSERKSPSIWEASTYTQAVFCREPFADPYYVCRNKLNSAALKHYMNNFDFSGLRLDAAFRYACYLTESLPPS